MPLSVASMIVPSISHAWEPLGGQKIVEPAPVGHDQMRRKFEEAKRNQKQADKIMRNANQNRQDRRVRELEEANIKQQSIQTCEDKCHMTISSIELLMMLYPGVGTYARLASAATLEAMKWSCIYCCRSGNFYGQCIRPLCDQLAYTQRMVNKYCKQAAHDIGRMHDPMFGNDNDYHPWH